MSDESLARCISKLRRLLPPSAGLRVQSVYGYGYQLVSAAEGARAERRGHRALIAIAEGAPRWAETVLHARTLLAWRDADSVRRAADLMRDLVAEAPFYMPARILLAEALGVFAHWNHDPTGLHRAEAIRSLLAVERLAPGTPGLSSVMGHMLDLSWSFADAGKRHAAALEDEPDDPLTHYHHGIHLDLVGRPTAAVEAFRRALALNPHSLNFHLMLSRQQFIAGDRTAAVATARSILRDAERDKAFPSFLHSMLRLAEANESAIETARVHEEARPHYYFADCHLATMFALAGEREQAVAVIERSGRSDPAKAVTFVTPLLHLGLVDEAVRRVEAAAAARVSFLPALLRKPENDGLSRHRRFGVIYRAVFGGAPSGQA
jgi:predicted Zn-dependent protease